MNYLNHITMDKIYITCLYVIISNYTVHVFTCLYEVIKNNYNNTSLYIKDTTVLLLCKMYKHKINDIFRDFAVFIYSQCFSI